MQHAKLVICLDGSAADVVLDLRRGSPTYGKFEIFDLRSEQGQMIYIPAGFAHGFCVTSASALMLYKVTTVYDASCDKGILWSSAGIPWPSENPILSSRDSGFCAFEEFVSPFSYA
jgi:dTDP-4-dehydrorhamnose 3,5-epimerase